MRVVKDGTVRRCPRCNEDVTVSRETWGKGDSYCRPCRREWQRRWREENIDKVAAHNAAKGQTRRELGSKRLRDLNLRQRYGVTLAKVEALVEQQGGLCAVCKRVTVAAHSPRGSAKPTSEHGQSHVDHDHATGEVRGVLCRSCNLVLGYAKDSVDVLQNAIDYLKEH